MIPHLVIDIDGHQKLLGSMRGGLADVAALGGVVVHRRQSNFSRYHVGDRIYCDDGQWREIEQVSIVEPINTEPRIFLWSRVVEEEPTKSAVMLGFADL